MPTRPSLLAPLALALFLGVPARADFSLIPAGLVPGDTFRVAFVSSAQTRATSADIADYDQFIANLAGAAGLGTYFGAPVTWQALASTPTVSALSRLPASSPAIYRIDGARLAASGADLWDSTLETFLNVQETGLPAVSAPTVWTGTMSDGSSSFLALGNTVDPFGLTGQWTRTNRFWVQLDTSSLGTNHRLYGFSSILTVPNAATSAAEPATLSLVALAALLLRRRAAAAIR